MIADRITPRTSGNENELQTVFSEKAEESHDCIFEGESSVGNGGREQLEADILMVAALRNVQDALRIHVATLASDHEPVRSSRIVAAALKPEALMRELHRGLKAIINASCDRRLEVFHWMVMRLYNEGTAADIIDWFLLEAERQKNEAEGEEKEIVEDVFGV